MSSAWVPKSCAGVPTRGVPTCGVPTRERASSPLPIRRLRPSVAATVAASPSPRDGEGTPIGEPSAPSAPSFDFISNHTPGAVRNRRRRRRRRPRIAAATADTPPSPTPPRSAVDTRRRNPSPGPRVTREAATTTRRASYHRVTRVVSSHAAPRAWMDRILRDERNLSISSLASHLHSQRHGVQPHEHLISPVRERVELRSNPAIGTLSTEMNSDPSSSCVGLALTGSSRSTSTRTSTTVSSESPGGEGKRGGHHTRVRGVRGDDADVPGLLFEFSDGGLFR